MTQAATIRPHKHLPTVMACAVLVVLWATGTAHAAETLLGPASDSTAGGSSNQDIEQKIIWERTNGASLGGTLLRLGARVVYINNSMSAEMAIYDSAGSTLLAETPLVTIDTASFSWRSWGVADSITIEKDSIYCVAIVARSDLGAGAQTRLQSGATGDTVWVDNTSWLFGGFTWPASLAKDVTFPSYTWIGSAIYDATAAATISPRRRKMLEIGGN